MHFGWKSRGNEAPGMLHDTASAQFVETDRTLTAANRDPSEQQLKRATSTRKTFALSTSFLLLLSVVFLVLVEVGQTSTKPVPKSIYFLRLDLSQIIPASVPNAAFINTVAQTIGLHDFYDVGLWGFCEGYQSQGTTFCSKPKSLFWFNPVEILGNELIAGATIAIPTALITILNILRIVSNWMFGLFLAGACLSFVMIFLTPLSVYSRWTALPVGILTFFAACFTTIAAVLVTAIAVVVKKNTTSIAELNIGAELGIKIFIFMWLAAGFAILAWLIQMGLCCCCVSRRDVKKGKSLRSKHA